MTVQRYKSQISEDMIRITADKKKLTLLHLSFIHSLSKMLVNHGRSRVPIAYLCSARLRTLDARSAIVRPMREIETGANINTGAHKLAIDGLFWNFAVYGLSVDGIGLQ